MAKLNRPDLSKHAANGKCKISVACDDSGNQYLIDDLGRPVRGIRTLSITSGVNEVTQAAVTLIVHEFELREPRQVSIKLDGVADQDYIRVGELVKLLNVEANADE